MTYNEIRRDSAICTYITQADASLAALGFTEHSFAHVTTAAQREAANTMGNVLSSAVRP